MSGDYGDNAGAMCPVCYGHLRMSLNVEDDDKGGFWSGWECQGVCGMTWTDVDKWTVRETPEYFARWWRRLAEKAEMGG